MTPRSNAFHDSVETETRRIGEEVFADVSTSGPSIFRLEWWDDRIMNWSMDDESLKVQLFRFVDVLPMLHSKREVAEHIQSYFHRGEGVAAGAKPLPWPLRWGAWWAKPGTIFGDIAAWVATSNARRMAGRFIAGATPEEVLKSVERLREKRMAFTLDLLGEATVTESEADAYRDEYLQLLDVLGPAAAKWTEDPILDRDDRGPLPRVNLSIKATALNSQFDPIDPEGSYRTVAGRFREVLRAAKKHGALINLDMEHYQVKELTLDIFKRLLMEPEFRDWPDIGLAIQAYMPEVEADLESLLDWVQRRGTPIHVRLVKGAYWDYETVISEQYHWPTPLYTQKWQSDDCYERCTNLLLENHRWLRPAFASHNVRSLSYALAAAYHLGVPKGAYEIQMLYGMADPLKGAFVKRNERLRIYTPFGKLLPGMAYLVRRLLENTSNTSFLRATFVERKARAALLRAPAEVGHDYPSGATMPQLAWTRRETIPPFVNESLSDFSRAINRDRMKAALESVRSQFGREFPLWIGGQTKTSGQWLESRGPSDTGILLGKVSKATAERADEAVAAAVKAFPSWRATSVWKRCGVLFAVARKMRERRWELSAWISYECGKQWRESDADVAEAIDFCEYYARAMLELDEPRNRNLPGEENSYFYTPRGPTVVISPWNFPIAIMTGMAMAPLVAGNPVIIKPAEQSSIIGALLSEILQELDLPPGVVNFVPGLGEEVGQRLVEHPETAVVNFTGSVPVGMIINKTAAATSGKTHVKHIVAEMGGKNAIIVDDDADLDETVRGVVQSAFGYQGQKCSACSRVIVLPRVYDTFIARLKDAVASLAVGPAHDPAYTVGPVIDREARDRLLGVIERAKTSAKLLVTGQAGPSSPEGYYIAPHVFVDADPNGELGQVEFFGPVLAVFRAKDLDEALAIANGVNYALTGGCFSRNPSTLERVRREFLVGNLYLNRKITGANVDMQPFGGFKMSGIGAKAGGPDYLHHFLVPRTITENTLRRGFAPEDATHAPT
jgi:RHH-type transcriptional regulator, proline utilization regulon repressor / proline dehydrogenase / delta 1-pyrroline-5-carboxylate dehydrogenase